MLVNLRRCKVCGSLRVLSAGCMLLQQSISSSPMLYAARKVGAKCCDTQGLDACIDLYGEALQLTPAQKPGTFTHHKPSTLRIGSGPGVLSCDCWNVGVCHLGERV